MPIVAEHFTHVVGVDTHAATHSYAIIACRDGRLLDHAAFPTSPAGLARAADWIGRRTRGDLTGTLIAAEGTGSYGAQLSNHLTDIGYRVVEAPTPSTKRLRGVGKTDAMDAHTAARASLPMRLDQLRDRRADGTRDALQTLSALRSQLRGEYMHTRNALIALVRSHDLGIDARGGLLRSQIKTIAAWRTRTEPIDVRIARQTATYQAKRILILLQDLDANLEQLRELVTSVAPELLEVTGIGPVSAAVILTSWSHPGRIRSEAAFAKLAATCPIPASSGNTTRHRLNRGGDRRLNKAIHTIVLTRWRVDPATKAYITKRRSEGKTDRDIRRCLRRYVTREIYKTLQPATP